MKTLDMGPEGRVPVTPPLGGLSLGQAVHPHSPLGRPAPHRVFAALLPSTSLLPASPQEALDSPVASSFISYSGRDYTFCKCSRQVQDPVSFILISLLCLTPQHRAQSMMLTSL